MFDVNVIKVAKNKATKNLEKVNQDLEENLNKAIELFKQFAGDRTEKKLHQALQIFFEYIDQKRTNATPFFYISFSSFLLGDHILAEKYLTYTEEIDPVFSNLTKLKSIIKSV